MMNKVSNTIKNDDKTWEGSYEKRKKEVEWKEVSI